VHEVIVVGAGPGGSVAAAVLAKQGCEVLLLDKAEFPRDKVCGDAIGLSSLKLLSDLGLFLESRKRDYHYCDRIRAISPSGDVFEGSFPKKDGYYRHGYVIPRKNLDRVLWESALQQGAEFERLCVSEPIIERSLVCGVRGRIDGKVVDHRARITIAADGANSIIGRFLLAFFPTDTAYLVSALNLAGVLMLNHFDLYANHYNSTSIVQTCT